MSTGSAATASTSTLVPRISATTILNNNRGVFAHQQNCHGSTFLRPPLLLFRNRNKHANFRHDCSSASSRNESHPPPESELQSSENSSSSKETFWQKWKLNSAEMSKKLAKLGLAAVLAYGIIDGITYTTFFILAFIGYEKSTGQNPSANLKSLIGIVLLMWTGNNVTRPFRVAGAAALAPVVDNGMRRLQDMLKLSKLVYAFALVVGGVVTLCFSVVALLVLSRWGK